MPTGSTWRCIRSRRRRYRRASCISGSPCPTRSRYAPCWPGSTATAYPSSSTTRNRTWSRSSASIPTAGGSRSTGGPAPSAPPLRDPRSRRYVARQGVPIELEQIVLGPDGQAFEDLVVRVAAQPVRHLHDGGLLPRVVAPVAAAVADQ